MKLLYKTSKMLSTVSILCICKHLGHVIMLLFVLWILLTHNAFFHTIFMMMSLLLGAEMCLHLNIYIHILISNKYIQPESGSSKLALMHLFYMRCLHEVGKHEVQSGAVLMCDAVETVPCSKYFIYIVESGLKYKKPLMLHMHLLKIHFIMTEFHNSHNFHVSVML